MNATSSQKMLAICLTCCSFLLVHCEAPPTANTTSHELANTSASNSDEKQETVASLKSRLLQSYATYWPHVSSAYQHEQLPSVLRDPLPELRAFGVERVGVLLRDGEATEEELQLVVDLLRDTSSVVRLAAAQLLPEINIPGLPEFVAHSLATERNIHVIYKELAYFKTQPSPMAIRPTIALLTETPDGSATETLVILLNTYKVSNETSKKIVQIVKQLRRTNDSSSLITLEAMLGSARDQRKLIRLLDSDDVEVRLATARGFASSGYAEPLIERANDETFYEFALLALQQHEDIDTFKQLMMLYKENNEAWDTSAFNIAMQLNTSDFLRADDMLKRIGRNDVRILILTSLWEDAEGKSHAAQKAIARRAVPLMIDSGDAVGAVQLLDFFDESLEEDMLTLRFNAAISAAAWDTAADARSNPEPWILAWQEARIHDPTAASVIAQQITLRFIEQLSPEQKKLLGIEPAEALDNGT